MYKMCGVRCRSHAYCGWSDSATGFDTRRKWRNDARRKSFANGTEYFFTTPATMTAITRPSTTSFRLARTVAATSDDALLALLLTASKVEDEVLDGGLPTCWLSSSEGIVAEEGEVKVVVEEVEVEPAGAVVSSTVLQLSQNETNGIQ